MICTVQNCSNTPVIHILKVAERSLCGLIDVCSVHAYEFEPFCSSTQGNQTQWQEEIRKEVPFELEYMVGFDESNFTGLYFGEIGGNRKFVMRCGYFESIFLYDVIKNKYSPPDRPFTHRVFASAIQQLGGRIMNACVDAFENQVYHGKLRISRGREIVSVDLRPTDAFALAIIADAPVLVANSVLAKISGFAG